MSVCAFVKEWREKGGGQGVQKMRMHSGKVQNFAQQGAAAPALEKPSWHVFALFRFV